MDLSFGASFNIYSPGLCGGSVAITAETYKGAKVFRPCAAVNLMLGLTGECKGSSCPAMDRSCHAKHLPLLLEVLSLLDGPALPRIFFLVDLGTCLR
jgi:hypothetical protein